MTLKMLVLRTKAPRIRQSLLQAAEAFFVATIAAAASLYIHLSYFCASRSLYHTLTLTEEK
jgi:hypothetical protein